MRTIIWSLRSKKGSTSKDQERIIVGGKGNPGCCQPWAMWLERLKLILVLLSEIRTAAMIGNIILLVLGDGKINSSKVLRRWIYDSCAQLELVNDEVIVLTGFYNAIVHKFTIFSTLRRDLICWQEVLLCYLFPPTFFLTVMWFSFTTWKRETLKWWNFLFEWTSRFRQDIFLYILQKWIW